MSRYNLSEELVLFIGMNEEIKRIIRLASTINIMAINAIITARRAGTSAKGFSVLSSELRLFTTRLEEKMARLRELASDAVGAVASLLKHRRISRLISLAAKSCRASDGHYLQATLQVKEDANKALMGKLQGVRTALVRTLREARQLADRGRILARNAKIEAAYGGHYTLALSQVASEFEHTVEQIHESLPTLAEYEES